ncbi:LysR family transcriptional regulator ArgP [Pseudacidovorax intermedius]|uniref:LysR family transcriptional regulator n=1 Tax=Pseudacidovorax intermedius TaxID=433924 RepID=A0A147HC44_9BURK|nr:LysR family transcriptional regulator ArgP [Pseudacidovorax intermedius]KTT27492.1 LysR family transcriptional regulator [Pseudacidovorax intermedius]
MLDYTALAALQAVVREGSFERAARTLHVTPSAVSQRVRLLEERMGCALVVRGQPCTATDTGRRLCGHVEQVRLLEHDLVASLPAAADGRTARPRLSVAVNADSLAGWFMPAAARFAADAPVLLDLMVDDQDHTAERLRSGAVLAAVTALAEPAPGCQVRPLGAMRYVAAASPAFVAAHFAQGVDADALARAPSLRFDQKDELQARWVRQTLGEDVALPQHRVPAAHAFVAAAVSGMGWGLHPQALAAPHLAAGRLVELRPGTPLDVPLHWQRARLAVPLLAQLTQVVVQAAKTELLQ